MSGGTFDQVGNTRTVTLLASILAISLCRSTSKIVTSGTATIQAIPERSGGDHWTAGSDPF